EARIQCTRRIAAGEEVSVFYGWVTQNEPERDPCRCSSANCRGVIKFDVSDDEGDRIDIRNGALVTTDRAVHERLAEYAEYLQSIAQEQVQETIASTIATMKRRAIP